MGHLPSYSNRISAPGTLLRLFQSTPADAHTPMRTYISGTIGRVTGSRACFARSEL
jgi:hypothetical protein